MHSHTARKFVNFILAQNRFAEDMDFHRTPKSKKCGDKHVEALLTVKAAREH